MTGIVNSMPFKGHDVPYLRQQFRSLCNRCLELYGTLTDCIKTFTPSWITCCNIIFVLPRFHSLLHLEPHHSDIINSFSTFPYVVLGLAYLLGLCLGLVLACALYSSAATDQ